LDGHPKDFPKFIDESCTVPEHRGRLEVREGSGASRPEEGLR